MELEGPKVITYVRHERSRLISSKFKMFAVISRISTERIGRYCIIQGNRGREMSNKKFLTNPKVDKKVKKKLYSEGGESRGHISSVQFSHSVVSDSLRPHESQHARPPCPSPTPIHVHRVSDAIQPSHPRSSPSPPAPNPSQHQSIFQ